MNHDNMPKVSRFEDVDSVSFSGLQDCVAYCQQLNGYLFRGESTDRYTTTTSMLTRVRNDRRRPPKARQEIERQVDRVHVDLQRFLHLDADLALGFLQHYEVPTRVIDLTANPMVAAFFASGGDEGSTGLFAAIPITKGKGATFTNLTNHPKANRPRWQAGFTYDSTDLHKSSVRGSHGSSSDSSRHLPRTETLTAVHER